MLAKSNGKGWVRDEEVSVSLPNIFDLKHLSYWEKSYEHFLVIDKTDYELVLGNTWLTRLGDMIDGRDEDIGKIMKRKDFIIQE